MVWICCVALPFVNMTTTPQFHANPLSPHGIMLSINKWQSGLGNA